MTYNQTTESPAISTKQIKRPHLFLGKVTKFGHFGQTYVLFSKRLAKFKGILTHSKKKGLRNHRLMISQTFLLNVLKSARLPVVCGN